MPSTIGARDKSSLHAACMRPVVEANYPTLPTDLMRTTEAEPEPTPQDSRWWQHGWVGCNRRRKGQCCLLALIV
eukprot:1649124-Alexandrium_andersonii.AAC.1